MAGFWEMEHFTSLVELAAGELIVRKKVKMMFWKM